MFRGGVDSGGDPWPGHTGDVGVRGAGERVELQEVPGDGEPEDAADDERCAQVGVVEAMDAAGIDVSILSVVTPATQALPAREAVALARDANDEATAAVCVHPTRFRAFATLP